jgi:hypothetical protein
MQVYPHLIDSTNLLPVQIPRSDQASICNPDIVFQYLCQTTTKSCQTITF